MDMTSFYTSSIMVGEVLGIIGGLGRSRYGVRDTIVQWGGDLGAHAREELAVGRLAHLRFALGATKWDGEAHGRRREVAHEGRELCVVAMLSRTEQKASEDLLALGAGKGVEAGAVDIENVEAQRPLDIGRVEDDETIVAGGIKPL
jgi:hypothetical protein